MKQTTYDFATPNGIPGGLYDLTGYVCDSYCVGANDDVLKFGMGVARGSDGKAVAVTSETTAIEGILLNGLITEHEMNGDVVVRKGKTVGLIKQGRVWGRLTAAAVAAYGTPVYVVIADVGSTSEVGCFTDYAHKTADQTVLAVNAKFIGAKGTEGAAPIEIYPGVVNAAGASGLPANYTFKSSDFNVSDAGEVSLKG